MIEGLITNPGYPAKYLPNEDMAWDIAVPQGLNIQLKFSDWNLVNGDQLSIYEGDSANDSSLVWRYVLLMVHGYQRDSYIELSFVSRYI